MKINTHKRSNLCLKKLRASVNLAWYLISKMCATIFSKIFKSIHSQQFISKHRTCHSAFIRNRKFPFHKLVLFILGNLKSSYRKELDRFFNQIHGGIISQSHITQPAVSAARKHLVPKVYLELNRQTIRTFEKNAALDTWNGLRLLTIDGTTVRLPNVDQIRSHFGERSGGQGVACPLGRMSELFDPINKLTIEGLVTPIHVGEREHAH
jgi:hypothetical protein